MMRAALLSVAGLAAAVFMAMAPVSAAEYGTAAEAKGMLDRAVVEVKADKAAALVKFNDAKGAFRDRDLYVFCAAAGDGVLNAHPKLIGTDIRTIKDKTGKPFGQEMFDSASEGKVSEVSYMWPRPDGTEPVEKVSYVTKVGDEICGVGYYK
jgi:signal transduction histidine kinase